ncbi:hypothetical protein M9H77_17625 [Catharanthus roseus]|uniref:Uncharacterized protein n=1 Tax=Catharanthus roseus TaxID=4058 RepID=A0ACC0B552_CATRO|nr:hypothetical protein M9H77_17625 [Catharanthus roseus]
MQFLLIDDISCNFLFLTLFLEWRYCESIFFSLPNSYGITSLGKKRFSSKGHSGWRSPPNVPWGGQSQGRQQQPPDVQSGGFTQYPPYNHTPLVHPSTPQHTLENLVSKYVNSADIGMKSMKAVQRSQTASIHNMESQIRKLTRMITERPLGSLPSNMEKKLNEHAKVVTLRSGKELAKTSPMILEEEKGIGLAPEESTFPKEKEIQQKEVKKRNPNSSLIPLVILQFGFSNLNPT